MTISNNTTNREEHVQAAYDFLAAKSAESADAFRKALEDALESSEDEDLLFLRDDVVSAKKYGDESEYLEAVEDAAKSIVEG